MKRALPAALVVLAACGTSEPSEHIVKARSAIVKGTESDDAQDSTVLVMHYDALAKGGGAASGCSGSLLAPTLVLTARHCVSITDEGAACDANGKAVNGGKVSGDFDPAKIYVFGGKTRPDFLSGAIDPSRGTAIVTTGATTLCNNDIALLVLDKPVTGAVIAPIRLDGGPAKGELVTVVGWGISETEDNPKARRQRTGVVVADLGPHEDLGASEFRVGEGTCAGDSGGPALSDRGAVLGALSRGGNGQKGNGPETCLGGTNIFTSAAGHADVIRAAYARVGAAPWLEGQPMPTADAGTTVPVSTSDADDGCSASRVHSRAGSRGACSATMLFAFTVAVLFARRRRGNPARSSTYTG